MNASEIVAVTYKETYGWPEDRNAREGSRREPSGPIRQADIRTPLGNALHVLSHGEQVTIAGVVFERW